MTLTEIGRVSAFDTFVPVGFTLSTVTATFPVEAMSTLYGCGSAARALDAWRSPAAASRYSAAAKNDGHRVGSVLSPCGVCARRSRRFVTAWKLTRRRAPSALRERGSGRLLLATALFLIARFPVR